LLEKGQGTGDRADELLVCVEGQLCGKLKEYTKPATNRKGNTSTSGMLVFPRRYRAIEQLYFPGYEFILHLQHVYP
jgi:hypothetical protein